ncbi:hypothetical protein B1756_18865 [Natrarchaeobaculum aegyptiacum]|uniref:Uncharacterized protein n=2 Tax=Natrarchaeobaculum aegyptiacum TaxID=745377 RepID=A0A2Z2HWJ4_9EURY|nr:hypothetical protein B1756_18865 [Natrarchaeobaculum aegyptiacum]
MTSFAASPAVVDPAVADDADFEYRATQARVETASVAGQTLELTSYLSRYVRSRSIPFEAFGDGDLEVAAVLVATTPNVGVAGETVNPVAEMGHSDVAGMLDDRFDVISGDLEFDPDVDLDVDEDAGPQDERSVSVSAFDGEIEFATFDGVATVEDVGEVDVNVDVSRPDAGGDHVVVAGVYPAEGLVEAVFGDETDLGMGGLLGGDEGGDALAGEETDASSIDEMTGAINHGDDVAIDLEEKSEEGGGLWGGG